MKVLFANTYTKKVKMQLKRGASVPRCYYERKSKDKLKLIVIILKGNDFFFLKVNN